ncbi:MAG: DUF4124 domain-containing protein [Gammaproteobacteria bacterium]|nr:DUF4124 domain-containing protein [Gammaproteobacteria bacterium]
MSKVRYVKTYLAAGIVLIAATMNAAAAVYKWEDDEGNVTYSDNPSEEHKGEIVDVRPLPFYEATGEARQRLREQLNNQQSSPGGDAHEGDDHLPVVSDAVPFYESSEYLETVNADIALDWSAGEVVGQFSIVLRPKPSMPDGVYLEAFFEDPLDPYAPIVIGRTRHGSEVEGFISPKLRGLKCKDYWIAVYVCHWSGCVDNPRDSDPKVWSVHWQSVSSRVDTRMVKSSEEWIDVMAQLADGGTYCP